jgi:hypothetical protein
MTVVIGSETVAEAMTTVIVNAMIAPCRGSARRLG